jgi:hypothetical protein
MQMDPVEFTYRLIVEDRGVRMPSDRVFVDAYKFWREVLEGCGLIDPQPTVLP